MRFSGPTASYRLPTTISGTQLALQAPPYSSILGMLSHGLDQEIKPSDTRIAYRYTYEGKGMDLETIHRWKRNSSGSYTYNNITNIRKREIHYKITLELLLDNLDLLEELNSPKRQMTFGRSQDLATIEEVCLVEAIPTVSGKLWGTLLPINIDEDIPADGMFYNLPEYFKQINGKIRRAKHVRTFLALPQYKKEIVFGNLLKVTNNDTESSTMYLHKWLN